MNIANFIYPDLVSLYTINGTSDENYAQINYTPVSNMANLVCSIQFTGITGKPMTDSGSDASNETYWNIFIPFPQNKLSGVIPNNLIHSRDKLIDQNNKAYEVVGPYWDSLGYNLRCKLLVA